jgi:hypothetical protein
MVYLNVWYDTAFKVETTQSVSSLANGNYSFSVWFKGGTITGTPANVAFTKQYVFVRGYDASDLSAQTQIDTTPSDVYVQITVPTVSVTSGSIVIGFYSESPGKSWAHFDDAALTVLP